MPGGVSSGRGPGVPGLRHSLCAGERGVWVCHGAAISRASTLVLGQQYVRAGNPHGSPGGEVGAHSLVGLSDGWKNPSCIA